MHIDCHAVKSLNKWSEKTDHNDIPLRQHKQQQEKHRLAHDFKQCADDREKDLVLSALGIDDPICTNHDT